MEDRFTLTIRLGNELMEAPCDVAAALRVVADRLDEGVTSWNIRDNNGNAVGEYAWEQAS